MILKNKKGFNLLGEHTLGLVITVLCIIGLVYLGSILAGYYLNKQQLDQAKGSLESISFAIFNLDKIGDSKEILILSPKDWWINVFPENGKFPPSCENKPCVCFSKTPPWGAGAGSSVKFSDWDNPSDSICQTFENINLEAYRKLSPFAFGCKGYAFQLEKVPAVINITLKEANLIYFKEVC
jgi:hypothetical protein